MSEDEGGVSVSGGRMARGLDDTDRALVELLRADGRMSVRKLAERAHVSRATAYARIERLERDGVITGYRAVVDPQRYGYAVSAYIAVKLRQRSWHEFAERIAELSEVTHAAMLAGEYDGLLLVRATDTGSLRDVVLERLQDMPEVLGTQTMFILDELPHR